MYIHEHTSVCAYAHACIHMHAHTDVKMSLAFLIYPVQAPLISSPAQTSLLCKGFFKYHRTHYSCLGGGGSSLYPLVQCQQIARPHWAEQAAHTLTPSLGS